MSWFSNLFCKSEKAQIKNLATVVTKLQVQLQTLQKKYDTDCAYYEDRIKKLNELLMGGLTKLPDLSSYKGKTTPVTNLSVIFGKMLDGQADGIYYSLLYSDWQSVLAKIIDTFKATWTTEVFDCDDFALMMSAMLAYSIYKSGFDHQLAFGIAWSDTHAYNVFISNGVVYVFEPQDGKIIGLLGNTPAPYNTKQVWFMS